LGFAHTRVAALVPGVVGLTRRRVGSFVPAATAFVGELRDGTGAKAVGDGQSSAVRGFGIAVGGEAVAARPRAARSKGMECGEPGEFGDRDVGLAEFP